MAQVILYIHELQRPSCISPVGYRPKIDISLPRSSTTLLYHSISLSLLAFFTAACFLLPRAPPSYFPLSSESPLVLLTCRRNTLRSILYSLLSTAYRSAQYYGPIHGPYSPFFPLSLSPSLPYQASVLFASHFHPSALLISAKRPSGARRGAVPLRPCAALHH